MSVQYELLKVLFLGTNSWPWDEISVRLTRKCQHPLHLEDIPTKPDNNSFHSFQADASLEMEHRDFIRAGLEYVCLIQEVQERKKFEFVETVRQQSLIYA